jgi:hypothetical protein
MADRPERPVRRGPRQGAGPRLAVIEGFAGRRSAIPFALLILAVLVIGLVGLLMLNTAMDENSVRTAQAQQRQAALTDREQQLSQQLAGLSAPAALAAKAAALGLVPNPQPAFLNPSSGAVLGTASPAPTPSPAPSPTPTQTAGTPTGTASGSASGTATATSTATATADASGAALGGNAVGAPGAGAPAGPPASGSASSPASGTASPPATTSSTTISGSPR